MPLGFDPAIFFPDENTRNLIRKKTGLNGKVIAYFGRLSREKGIHVLISALQDLKDLSWQLMMDEFDEYASGYTRQIKRLLADANIMERVVFVRPSHYEIPQYMNAADIVVVPSIRVPEWKEQYGRVAAEAMACGKQVVASATGALPELLDGYGYLFEESNQAKLSSVLRSLLEERMLNKSSNEIARYAKENLSIQKQFQVMETALN
jgi:glycosyltransferase involved in cell wall biosynthesis